MINVSNYYGYKNYYYVTCFHYPDRGKYVGNLFDFDGKAIGGFSADTAEEVTKIFPDIFIECKERW